MGYEMQKMKGKRPDTTTKGKAKGEEKVPHKSPKIAIAKKMSKKKM